MKLKVHLHTIRDWMQQHKKWTIVISIATVLLISGVVVTALYFTNRPAEPEPVKQTVVEPKPAPEPPKYYSPLTGSLVKSEDKIDDLVTAIMIENSPDARPQSGLKDSGVVFEAIAEGGITRFLVLYQQEKPQLVGPVRSLRSYYVDWLAAFQPSVAHIGGSATALAEVRNGSYRDIDQFFNPGAYWRATDRYAPHNVYTSFERLDALNASKGYTTSSFTGFSRKDSQASAVPTATSINVVISSALFNSSYVYDATTNLYNRSQAGAAHTDREAGQIAPRVVIVLKVPMVTVFEDGYRQQLTTIGSGNAVIFQDGIATEVTWSKPAKTAQITFTDAEGKEVALARGQTWITAIPSTTGVVTWQ